LTLYVSTGGIRHGASQETWRSWRYISWHFLVSKFRC